jgi:hypothetical protein
MAGPSASFGSPTLTRIFGARPARSNTRFFDVTHFFDIVRRAAGSRVFCRVPQCFSGGIQTFNRPARPTAGACSKQLTRFA